MNAHLRVQGSDIRWSFQCTQHMSLTSRECYYYQYLTLLCADSRCSVVSLCSWGYRRRRLICVSGLSLEIIEGVFRRLCWWYFKALTKNSLRAHDYTICWLCGKFVQRLQSFLLISHKDILLLRVQALYLRSTSSYLYYIMSYMYLKYIFKAEK